MLSRAQAALARAGAVATAVLVLGMVGGALIVATEPSIVAWVEVENEACEVVNDASPAKDRCTLNGFERHGGAFLLLGGAAMALAVAASLGGSAAAGGGVLAIGVVVLGFTLLGDLPETTKATLTEAGTSVELGAARAGFGFYMELTGGALCLIAGALCLAAAHGGRRPKQRRTASRRTRPG